MHGLYVHIPFCMRKCGYCDFASTDRWNSEDLAAYMGALAGEISRRGHEAGESLSSLYVGGGTPTVLTPALWEELFGAIHRQYSLDPDAEITVEANPGTLNEEGLRHLRFLGVNRLSLGVQSFDDWELAAMGRIHTGSQARQMVRLAAQAGFANLSIDLMQGVPEQTEDSFRSSLSEAAGLPLTHVSVYELKIEPDTAFFTRQQQGRLDLPADGVLSGMDGLREQILGEAGFGRYEISNYARPGQESRHNLLYWRNRMYTGVGLAACSRVPGKRITNTTDMVEYIRAHRDNRLPDALVEPVDRAMALEEELFLGLRLQEGIRAKDLQERHGVDLFAQYAGPIRQMTDEGLLSISGEGICLTRRGMDWANRVMTAFMR